MTIILLDQVLYDQCNILAITRGATVYSTQTPLLVVRRADD